MECKETSSVILLKAVKGEQDPFLKKLNESGFNANCIPVLQFTFTNIEELRMALLDSDSYSGIIFTSSRSIEAVTIALGNGVDQAKDFKNNSPNPWSEKFCFCVGKATATEAEKAGFLTARKSSGSAEAMLIDICSEKLLLTKPLLYPCGNLRRDLLPQKCADEGIELRQVMCYLTEAETNIKTNFEFHISQKGVPTYIVFFSPSGLEYTYDIIKKLELAKHGVNFIAIGSTTMAALDKKGIEVYATAESPTPEGLLAVLRGDHFTEKNSL